MKTKIFLSIVFFFITLVVLEVISRTFNIPVDLERKYKRQDFNWQQKNVILNSVGYRDREFSKDKPKNTFRIYAVGDSYTFGWLINNPQESYPKLLEKALAGKTDKKVEVINAGVPGFSISEDLQRFILEGQRYHPDIVLLGILDKEALVSNTYFYRKDKIIPDFIKNLRIYAFTFGKIFKLISEKQNHDYLLQVYSDKNSQDWQKFSKAVLALQKVVNLYNAKLGIVVYPHIHPAHPNDKYDLYPYNQRFREFGKEHDIIIIDPLNEFLKHPHKEKLVISPADAHPTREMNNLIVSAFLERFEINQYLKNYKEYTPLIETKIITKNSQPLGSYRFIRKISSSYAADFPWIYFETKNDNGIQEFPLENLSIRQTTFNEDKIQIVKATAGVIGADIIYYTYPQKNGTLIVPRKLYGYPIVGFNNIYGIYVDDGNNIGDFFDSFNIIKNETNYVIRYTARHNYQLVKLNLKTGIRRLDIDPLGKIQDMQSTVIFNKVTKSDTDNISLLMPSNNYGLPEFFDGKIKRPYVFVDNKFTLLNKIEAQKDSTILSFESPIKKGQKVEMISQAEYALKDDELISLELEINP